MDDNPDVSERYTFSPPLDLPTTLETFQIQYLDVNETRALIIFNTAILNLESAKGTLTDLESAVITIYEPPRETNIDEMDHKPLTFIKDFINQITSIEQTTALRHK
ncbi:hypothetical protein [Natronococcus wangiae]|uniref:hypothetical protein n=1 Tax=Natronococcus wangiae TaxID=3068275 RepID=UPI00273E4D2A|nr:hypothetical protein [Natronococcus sp. AD5]